MNINDLQFNEYYEVTHDYVKPRYKKMKKGALVFIDDMVDLNISDCVLYKDYIYLHGGNHCHEVDLDEVKNGRLLYDLCYQTLDMNDRYTPVNELFSVDVVTIDHDELVDICTHLKLVDKANMICYKLEGVLSESLQRSK